MVYAAMQARLGGALEVDGRTILNKKVTQSLSDNPSRIR